MGNAGLIFNRMFALNGFGYLKPTSRILKPQHSTETLTEPVVESVETGGTIETLVTRPTGCFYSGGFSRIREL